MQKVKILNQFDKYFRCMILQQRDNNKSSILYDVSENKLLDAFKDDDEDQKLEEEADVRRELSQGSRIDFRKEN